MKEFNVVNKVLFLILFTLIFIGGVSAFGIRPPFSFNDLNTTLYLKFDNNSLYGENQTYLYDYSVNGKNGTAYYLDFNLTGDILGNGTALFNGSAYINLGNVFALNNNNDSFSQCRWIKTNKTGVNQWIWSKYPSSTPNYDYYIDTNNKIRFQMRNTSYTLELISPTIIILGYWYYLCETYNATDGNMSIYINGKIDNSSIGPINGLSTSASYTIGKRSTGTANYFYGQMDDFIRWNGILELDDVYNIYTAYEYFTSPPSSQCYLNNWSDGCEILNNTYINQSGLTYYIGGINNSVAVYIKNSNIIIDGNGTTLIGNNSLDTKYVMFRIANGISNVTLRNFNIINITNGFIGLYNQNISLENIRFSGNMLYGIHTYEMQNSLFQNISVLDNIDYGVYSEKNYIHGPKGVTVQNSFFNQTSKINAISIRFLATNCSNNRIINNTIYNQNLGVKGCINSLIENNRIYGNITNKAIMLIWSETNATVINNLIDLSVTNRYVQFDTTINSTFKNNIMLNNSLALSNLLVNNNLNLNIINNTLKNSDTCIRLTTGNNYTYILNNTIENCYTNTDGYNMGIGLNFGRNYNTLISNNIINKSGSVGIMSRNAETVTIKNNIIQCLTDIEKQSLYYWDYGEPPTAIGLYTMYKAFSGNGSATIYSNSTILDSWRNYNVDISNNTYVNCNVKLVSRDTVNLSYLGDGKKIKFDAPYYVYKNNIYYIDNYSTNITRKHGNNFFSNLQMNIGSNGFILFNYTLNSIYEFWVAINISNGTTKNEFNRYELNNAFVVYNYTAEFFTGDKNINLSSYESVFIANNYTLSEPRISSNGYYEGEPFTLTKSISSNLITYHITSNLTNSITVPVNLTDVNCQDLKYVSVTPNGLTAYTPTYSCIGDTLYIEDVTLTYSTDSNVILLSYTVPNINPLCDNIFAGYLSFNPFITIFSLIAIVIFVIILGLVFVIANRYNDDNISTQSPSFNFDSKILIGVFLSILVVAILLVISLVVLGNMCSFG